MAFPEYPANLQLTEKMQNHLLDAARSLSALDSVVDVLPNVDVLVELLPLQESRLSCNVENIVTTQDEVFRVFSVGEGPSDASVRDVLGYYKAIKQAWDEDLSIEMIESVCSVLKRKSMKIRKTERDYVHLSDTNGKVVYVPPSGDMVPELLQALFNQLDESSYDPLIKMIIFHALFEMIHPLKDGNGRTGRILNEVLLKKYGLLSRPVLCLSRFLMEYRKDYYRLLRIVERDGKWDKFIIFMLTGIKESADNAILLIKEINRSLQNAYRICNAEKIPYEIVDLLYSHPYIRVKHLVDANLMSRNTASVYLNKLENLGILAGTQAGKGKIYCNVDLMQIVSMKK